MSGYRARGHHHGHYGGHDQYFDHGHFHQNRNGYYHDEHARPHYSGPPHRGHPHNGGGGAIDYYGHDNTNRMSHYKNNGRGRRGGNRNQGPSNAEKSYQNINMIRGQHTKKNKNDQQQRRDSELKMSQPMVQQLTLGIAAEVAKQQQVQAQSQTSPEALTMIGDIFIGFYDDFIKNKSLLDLFVKGLGNNVAPASTVITAKSLDFPQNKALTKKKDGRQREIRHLIVRFKPEWFATVLENTETRQKFLKGKCTIADMFESFFERQAKAIKEAYDFYKPHGRVFVICTTGALANIDTVTAGMACEKGYTIIQLNNDGLVKFGTDDLQGASDEKVVTTFAKRIGRAIAHNNHFTRKDSDQNKALSPNATYEFPVDMGRVVKVAAAKQKK